MALATTEKAASSVTPARPGTSPGTDRPQTSEFEARPGSSQPQDRPQTRGGGPGPGRGPGPAAGPPLDGDQTLRKAASQGTLPRPQSSPAGDGRLGIGSPGLRAGVKNSKPAAPLYKKSLPLFFNYRKESAALARIEHSPIVQLYPGMTAGGTVSSLNANSRRQASGETGENGGDCEQRNKPSVFQRFPDFEEQFETLVRKCTANQRDTRGLYRRMRQEESALGEKVAVLQDKLRIMQSMPDISMPAREFDLFIKNAMEQQKALDKEMSGQFNSESLGTKHRGSIRHIFPLRNVATGRVAKGERATIWQV